MTVRQASLFWVISDMMPRPKKFWIIQTKRIYVASYPFLKNGTIVDAGGYEVFAIVPASDWSISVYASEMTEDAVYKDYLDFPLYEVHLMK